MAIQLNDTTKTGIISAIRGLQTTSSPFTTSSTLKVYPSSVSFPSVPVNTTSGFPTSNILTYTNLTYSMSGNTIIITAGTTSANASAAGTLAWWAILPASAAGGVTLSDSIGLSGSGSILTVNTLTPTNGQSVTITFNLSLA